MLCHGDSTDDDGRQQLEGEVNIAPRRERRPAATILSKPRRQAGREREGEKGGAGGGQANFEGSFSAVSKPSAAKKQLEGHAHGEFSREKMQRTRSRAKKDLRSGGRPNCSEKKAPRKRHQ